MILTLRSRFVLTVIPMLLLLAAVGSAGMILLNRLSGRIDAILHENYRSVNYMERLNESLERIDSSFNFALAGREEQARTQNEANWKTYQENLAFEQVNITLKGERELVTQLADLTEQYRRQGDALYGKPSNDPQRMTSYHDRNGLLDLFKQIKEAKTQTVKVARPM